MADELNNDWYLWGVDYLSEIDLALSVRATRVLYERELRDKGVDLNEQERRYFDRNPTLQLSMPKGAPNLERHALHAAALEFDHPESGVRQRFESPLAADMSGVVDWLRERERAEA